MEKLASYLDDYTILKSILIKYNFDADKIALLTRNCALPYEYLNSQEKLKETHLPPKESFYTTFMDSAVSDEDYELTKLAWAAFTSKTLCEYVSLYMKTEVFLLADVFEHFREQCLRGYGLDSAHCYTSPGFTWKAMLKFIKIKLELLTDVDMRLLIELSVKGGISQCANRYALVNNKYMPIYDEIIYLVYFDAKKPITYMVGL